VDLTILHHTRMAFSICGMTEGKVGSFE